MRIIIVTGMSGAGKTQALRMLEDMGYFSVDNLPSMLLPQFIELCLQPTVTQLQAAVVVDVRGGAFFDAETVLRALAKSREYGTPIDLLFMDANDDLLIARYKESRREHPMLSQHHNLESAIRAEREAMEPLRERATHVIETSKLPLSTLREQIAREFGQSDDMPALQIHIVSFGFKRGMPRDADFAFDVRFLPNPFYEQSLKRKTGLDPAVRDYALNNDMARAFMSSATQMLLAILPGFVREGRNRLIIAVGCTGGMHRSVAVAESLGLAISAAGYRAHVEHRDRELEIERYR